MSDIYPNMRILKQGMQGKDVEQWQNFLRGEGFTIDVDGDFGSVTKQLTERYQGANGLSVDGVVGQHTLEKALTQGFAVLENGATWPPVPDGVHPLSYTDRDKLFGGFKFEPAPSHMNPEGIKILDGWSAHNIVEVDIPELAMVGYRPLGCKVAWNVKGKDQLVQLFKDWQEANLLDKILTWGGSWNPRFVRGSKVYLSNHAYGTAFDINVPWNPLGHEPMAKGKKGSVRELVELAVKNGFYWGGWFHRVDGMHFELREIL